MDTNPALRAYDFSLHFILANTHEDPAFHLEALEANCGDATVGIGVPGKIALAFSRAGFSIDAAIAGASEDVQRAIPDAVLTQVQIED